MDVYRQASRIVQAVREGKGTAKGLCLEKQVQKKKQTYAVVCETLRYWDALYAMLEKSEFLENYPNADPDLAMVMAYDQVVGKGVNTRQDATAVAVFNNGAMLTKAFNSVIGQFPAKEREQSTSDLLKYARVNTLKVTFDEAFTMMKKRGQRDEPDSLSSLNVAKDIHIPDLLVFPPNTDLHNHPLVRTHKLVLQDKASCLPPCVLLNAVPVESEIEYTPPTHVIDGCAAPGNKTTQLAALGQGKVNVLAVEMDEGRCATLKKRVDQLGASDYVLPWNESFFDLSSDDRNAGEMILLDPSCSSSGVVSRVDVELSDRSAKEREKVSGLARMQKRLLTHAMLSFDKARRIVYSTCSVNVEENEEVVASVLQDERVVGKGWKLANIMPDTWTTRGQLISDVDIPLTRCIRCDPEKDRTNGFFVACFDRKV
jgi:25S rRNA (cytosine2278-C5)-methyltransferase